ncbi:hypothetical protein OH710_01435 [Pseudomonas capsici]|uniref:hypothetical protein n=1 Tax=Pseudomonas capsici TaxID=2810614 RepID=UPI0021F131BE|nr:hypothetical protein [Pseudomonas capsici]MCV4271292.1 hypothetical protein [Pseudomonas capsici]
MFHNAPLIVWSRLFIHFNKYKNPLADQPSPPPPQAINSMSPIWYHLFWQLQPCSKVKALAVPLNASPTERASAAPIVKRAFFSLFFMETSSITRLLCGLAGEGAAVVKTSRNSCGRAATLCFIELHLNKDNGGVITTETTLIQRSTLLKPI